MWLVAPMCRCTQKTFLIISSPFVIPTLNFVLSAPCARRFHENTLLLCSIVCLKKGLVKAKTIGLPFTPPSSFTESFIFTLPRPPPLLKRSSKTSSSPPPPRCAPNQLTPIHFLQDAVQVFSNQNASFAQELRICGLEGRAEQRRRL